ncbi:MAG: beta-lactamase family protein [Ignavibacteriales bacterium]|nr:beta-lactamase family protein [Ignavibacteriales bacterium]
MIYKILFGILFIVGVIALFIFNEEPLSAREKIISDSIQIKIDVEQNLQVQKLDKFFNKRNKVNGFNGTVLFAEDGKIVYENAFGVSNLKTKEKNNINTKFQIASVSKPFTSYAIMLLKQEGELSYEDSIQHYFPDFPYKGITIKLLMIHKSGLPEYFYFAENLWEDKTKPITNMDVVKLLSQEHPQRYYLPDKKYNYINTNYCLLAAIVEKVTGDTFEEFMTEEVFEPLEMKNTFIRNKANDEEHKNVATGYAKRKRVAEDTYLNGVVGDKGVYTTVEDMLKFDQALYKGEPVETQTLEEAFEPAHERLYISDNYGFGWRINASDSTNKIVYHTGWWKGFRSYFIRELGKKKTIIVLSNFSAQSIFGTKQLIELFN